MIHLQQTFHVILHFILNGRSHLAGNINPALLFPWFLESFNCLGSSVLENDIMICSVITAWKYIAYRSKQSVNGQRRKKKKTAERQEWIKGKRDDKSWRTKRQILNDKLSFCIKRFSFIVISLPLAKTLYINRISSHSLEVGNELNLIT